MDKRKLLPIIIIVLLIVLYAYQSGAILQPAASNAPQAAQTAAPVDIDAPTDPSDAPNAPAPEDAPEASPPPTEAAIDEHGAYTSRDDVALYIHTYGRLPDNFITKQEAEALGWDGGGLDDYAYGKCIGGSHFGNYEGLLPERGGRRYTECDIDTLHRSSRGAKRIVFSNDGLVYYTDDHYDSFTLLYGEE